MFVDKLNSIKNRLSLTGVIVFIFLMLPLIGLSAESGRDWHVSVKGSDQNQGDSFYMLLTIQEASKRAYPGDRIIVHEGVYREWVKPVRGGESDSKRILYMAAEGEQVELRGSEVMTQWELYSASLWVAVIPNSFFGDYNPFADEIRGDWFTDKGRTHHTGAVFLNGHWLTEASSRGALATVNKDEPLWFSQVDNENTTLWAQFPDIDPRDGQVEISSRQAVFYPIQTNINYITVRGFRLSQAATQWAPPTAEQQGLIGTNWSKGWIIEDNEISYSTCTGITLGKYGDEWDNTSAHKAAGYVETIERATENGWNRETIGSHIVRNNEISHCEQAGLVGSLGAVFSTIEKNSFHDIHIRQLFTGAEMAGVKIHAAIDMKIIGNHFYRCNQGLWLDWMAQGTRVTANLFHDNKDQDLFLEVNHGPVLVDNNIMLSRRSVLTISTGIAYVHNLMAGNIWLLGYDTRMTPWMEPHSTTVAGLMDNKRGGDRFVNNIFIGTKGLERYRSAEYPSYAQGNLYLKMARVFPGENRYEKKRSVNPHCELSLQSDGWYLNGELDLISKSLPRQLVSAILLGKTCISGQDYNFEEGFELQVISDYFGFSRNQKHLFPGPFSETALGGESIRVFVLE